MAPQTGQHFVVSGAGTGIGRAIALRLAEDGATLTLLGRRLDPLAETAGLIDGDVGIASCDIRDAAAVDAAFASAAEVRGPLRGAVANAGIGGPNEAGPQDRFDDLVATNLNGTYHTLRAAQRHLVAGPEPRSLVAVASILGRFGVPGYTGYCASKTGILGLVRALAHELAADNIEVNALCPGWVDTEMAWQGIDAMAEGMGLSRHEAWQTAMAQVPMGRMSRPEDVAGVVAWLMSPDSRGVTGQGIDVNGGAWMS